MDNETLDELRLDGTRRFWIVLWGIPENSPDEDEQIFDQPFYDHGLTRNVPDMNIGDVLFVHRIHVAKIIYIGEVIASPRKSTADEIEKEEWRRRYPWSVAVKNLTPAYGQYWRSGAERTFTLNKQFNALHPQDPVNISRLLYGSPVKICKGFAEFILNSIISLEIDKVMREDAFRSWLLINRSIGTVGSRLSNCRILKKWEGDLDEHFDRDQLRGLLERLTYTKEDERYSRPARHNIPIDGNIYNGTATYKAAVSLYKQFRADERKRSLNAEFNAADINAPVERSRAIYKTGSVKTHAPERESRGVSQDAPISVVSASQLADWRRKLIRMLVELEDNDTREVISVGERIGRLQRSGAIPREIVAMMRTITEMRNATEYQAKTLTGAESSAVKASWEALQEWASGRGIDSLA